MKASECVTQWVKIGTIPETISYIGKEVVCFGVGCFIKFINLRTFQHILYDLKFHHARGEGVKCIRGHRSLNMFAYAEDCQKPDLYVVTYPKFEIIFKVDGSHADPEGYTTMSFSDTSLLFTLGELPNYTVTVWDWRKDKKYAESKNELLCERQIIRCSFGRPMYLAQMGVRSKNLLIWDVFDVCQTVIFAKHIVKFGVENPTPFCDICWSSEGGLFIVDDIGSIYTVDSDFTLQKLTGSSAKVQSNTRIVWYKNGVVTMGPDGKLRRYNKSEATGEWICDSEMQPEIKIVNILCNKGEKILGVTESNELVYFNFEGQITSLVKEDGCFNDFCLIYPTGEFLVTLSYGNVLNVLEVSSGKFMSSIKIKNEVLAIAENPELPYVALGTRGGELLLVSIYNQTTPSIIASFHLTSSPINKVKIFENGRVIIAGYLDIGEFYIIEGYPGSQMQIVTNITTNSQINDYVLVATENCYYFYVLPVTTTRYLAGNEIIRYKIVDRQIVNVKTYSFENADTLYCRIIHRRDRQFYAIPFQSRIIHVMESKRGDNIMKKINEIRSAHLFRRFDMHISTYHAVTWGFDGIVAVTDNHFKKDVGITVAHHRYSAGVRKAYVDPLAQYTAALGYDGVLAVMRMPYNNLDQSRKDYLYNLKSSEKISLHFTRRTLGFIPELRFKNMTWIDTQNELRIEKEQADSNEERRQILQEFHDIQTILQGLVTKNLDGLENEKIDLVEFHLDTWTYNKLQMDNREECKQRESYLRALIVAQDKVSRYLIENFWNKMDYISKVLKGIFTAGEATNYGLLPKSPEALRKLAWVEEQLNMEKFISNNTFRPYISISKQELRELIAQRPCAPKEDYKTINLRSISNDMEDAKTSQSIETKTAIAGSLTELYIAVNPLHYQQWQIVTYYQSHLKQIIVDDESLKLKREANRFFDETMKQKEREMCIIKQKNNRLRHIISEHNYFSDYQVHVAIVDPEWTQEENPITITRVADNELTVIPYISPSEQAIIEAKVAEEERTRILLLADDFRERALMTMMNGVLEVKWEDELKKDVQKPICMVEKKSESFNEEDIRAVQEYEEKVVILNSEREKYKNLLEVEFNRLSTSVRNSIRNFNQKVWECTRYKMYIDSAINQENLQVNRTRMNQGKRIDLDETESNFLKSGEYYEDALDQQNKVIAEIQEKLEECKSNIENLQVKEKTLEKAFRKDIQEMSPVVQDIAGRLYKKRPKANFRNATPSAFNELAKGIVTYETRVTMHPDCVDYLKSLDQLDYFTGLPLAIDEPTYSLICRLRRQKIELELRLRSNQLQVQDSEYIMGTFQSRCVLYKQKISEINTQIEKVREDRLRLLHNMEIQIVLRRGLIEVPLCGKLEDFENAIFVSKKEIIDVNNYIVAAGNKKLKVIKKNMNFRRNIMSTEWDHKYLRMQINDLLEQKFDIENTSFTKEMQTFMHNKELGRKNDNKLIEHEHELITADYRKQIKEKKDKFIKIQRQLDSYKRSNEVLDVNIKAINIDLCSFKEQKDYELESQESEIILMRTEAMLTRRSLVEQIQKNYNEILILQTERELLRLRTYPTFKYKVINNND